MTDHTATVGAFGQALMARLDTLAEFTDEPGMLTHRLLDGSGGRRPFHKSRLEERRQP